MADGVTLGLLWPKAARESTNRIVRSSQGFAQKHGYNFAVPVRADRATFPQPLRAMGRFEEAVATHCPVADNLTNGVPVRTTLELAAG